MGLPTGNIIRPKNGNHILEDRMRRFVLDLSGSRMAAGRGVMGQDRVGPCSLFVFAADGPVGGPVAFVDGGGMVSL